MADVYPDLISSVDSAGNAIINITAAERKLAASRKESAEAAIKAAAANYAYVIE